MEASLEPMAVDQVKGPRLALEQLDELRRRAAQCVGGVLLVVARFEKNVESLGKQGREISMFRIDDDPAATTSALPELARLISGELSCSCYPANLQGQPDPQPE